MTAHEAAKICCFKSSEPIRRMVYRGELSGIALQKNRLLIPRKEFWEWFNTKTVKPKVVKPVDMPELELVANPEEAA